MMTSSGTRSGFTLLEVLIAVAVIALVASVLLTAHARTLRAEQTAQALEASRLEAEKAATEFWLGNDPRLILADVQADGWAVQLDAAHNEGANAPLWWQWTIAPSNQPLVRSIIYLKQETR
jgi:prepilin-type N-terminal cleavage/methylation domain-containing protein